MKRQRLFVFATMLIMASMILSACGSTPTAAPVTAPPATAAPATMAPTTAPVATEAPTTAAC